VKLGANSRVRYAPAGGGGIGDPVKRDPEKVLEDVKDGYVTPRMAKSEYGVVIRRKGSGGHWVDYKATEGLRSGKCS
jgi:N-methylhydantoinase B